MSKTTLLVAFLAAAVLPLIMSACAEAQFPAPALGIEQFSGAAHGPCRAPQIAVDITTGNFYTCLEPNWVFVGPGGSSSPPFSNVTAGTNTTAAMLVGSGASLKTTGTGQMIANGLPVLTVATLPASPFSGQLAFVTDGTSATDCTTGGGSTVVLCRYTGTAWSGYAGGGSGSGTVNSGTQYAAVTYSTSGAAVSAVPAPTTNGHWYLGYNVLSGVAVALSDIQAGFTAGTVNGSTATYQFAPGDEGTFVVHDRNATAANTASIPSPTTLGNPDYDSGWCNNSTFTDALTPLSSWTIALGNNAPTTSISVAPGECIRFFPDPFTASQWDAIPSFTTAGSPPGGSTTQVQYNNAGAFAGTPNITVGTNPAVTILSPGAADVPLELNTPASPTADLLDLDVNGVKTTSFDSAGNLAAPSVKTGTTPPACVNGTGGVACLAEGTAPTAGAGVDQVYADSTAHALKASYNGGSFFAVPQTIATGTATMGTTQISANSCAAAVTVAAAGVLTTDAINWSFNAAPGSGYTGSLDIKTYVTAGDVNFLVCNETTVAVTPAAATLNWRVTR